MMARILVVDDEPGMLRAIERVVGTLHLVTTSLSSRRALELAAEAEPDLAILDIRMPDVDGFELMARLKARHPHLDVILMTGSIDDRDEKLVRAIRGAAFYFIQKPFDREALLTLVERCLELRRRRQENERHTQRLERELFAARAFQQGLLPPCEAAVEGLLLSCRQTASSELGGDLYDYAHDGNGRTAVLIADVAGHGAMAAMLTGVVKSAFSAARQERFEPSAVAERVFAAITPFGFDRFVTLIAALIMRAERRLTYVNAGHPPGLVWNADGRCEPLTATGPLISPALTGARWTEATIGIAPGDRVLLHTDGVLEALHDDGDDDEDGRLKIAVERYPGGGAPLVDALMNEIHHHTAGSLPPDDVTLVAVSIV